jgi:hypothetical protein
MLIEWVVRGGQVIIEVQCIFIIVLNVHVITGHPYGRPLFLILHVGRRVNNALCMFCKKWSGDVSIVAIDSTKPAPVVTFGIVIT